MSREEVVFDLLVEANPLPPAAELISHEMEGSRYLDEIKQRGSRIETGLPAPTATGRAKARLVLLPAALIAIVFALMALVLATRDGMPPPAKQLPEPETTVPWEELPELGYTTDEAGELRSNIDFYRPFRIVLPEGWASRYQQAERIMLVHEEHRFRDHDREIRFDLLGPTVVTSLAAIDAMPSVDRTEPTQVSVGGVAASYVRYTVGVPESLGNPGWTYEAYIVEGETALTITVAAQTAIFDAFLLEATPIIDSIVWQDRGAE